MGCGQSISCRQGPNADGGAASGQNVRDIFKIGGVLGCGAFGQVRECVEKATQETYAIKIMTKTSSSGAKARNAHWTNEAMFRREVSILDQLNHPGIIKFHCFYEDRNYLYAILEKCQGGELFDYILKSVTVEERLAAHLTYQMLDAIRYIHSHGYIHRDIKAENFLFSTTVEAGDIKLIDFGMSEKLSLSNGDQQVLTDVCGSPHYLAPELIRRKYGFKADMWALGVLVYLMLYGNYPFDGPSTSAIVKEILSRKLEWGESLSGLSCSTAASVTGVKVVSDSAQSFLKMLLQRNPDKRATAHEAMKHPWLACARMRMRSAFSSPRMKIPNAYDDDDEDEDDVAEFPITLPTEDDIQRHLGHSQAMIVIGNEESRFSQRNLDLGGRHGGGGGHRTTAGNGLTPRLLGRL